MSRPRKKPNYNPESVMNEFLNDVAEYYPSSSKISLRDVDTVIIPGSHRNIEEKIKDYFE